MLFEVAGNDVSITSIEFLDRKALRNFLARLVSAESKVCLLAGEHLLGLFRTMAGRYLGSRILVPTRKSFPLAIGFRRHVNNLNQPLWFLLQSPHPDASNRLFLTDSWRARHGGITSPPTTTAGKVKVPT